MVNSLLKPMIRYCRVQQYDTEEALYDHTCYLTSYADAEAQGLISTLPQKPQIKKIQFGVTRSPSEMHKMIQGSQQKVAPDWAAPLEGNIGGDGKEPQGDEMGKETAATRRRHGQGNSRHPLSWSSHE